MLLLIHSCREKNFSVGLEILFAIEKKEKKKAQVAMICTDNLPDFVC